MAAKNLVFAAFAASVVCFAQTAAAQTIRGTVVDVTSRPVAGVLVVMEDSAANVVARSLSNERGEFRVATARAGTYRVKTLRIGYRPTSSDPIALLAGSDVQRRLTLSGVQLALDTVRIQDRSTCRITSDAAAAQTFGVWEQARAALTAAQLTAGSRTITASTVAYVRTLEEDGRHIRQQRSAPRTALVAQPWLAASPDSLHRAGYVVTDKNNDMTFHAPSMETLLSNVFVEDHCFKLTTDRNRVGMVGLAFEPAPDRDKIPEIKGTLWVDRKSAELRRLEFRYVNISREQENAAAGGEMDFARMTNGGWVITRWDVRMPVLEQVKAVGMAGMQIRVGEIQVAGGELTTATANAAKDTLWSRSMMTLSGVVLDSASGAPSADARVSLNGTALETTTDARGRFAIAGVLPGSYVVETMTKSLASLGVTNQQRVSFADSSVVTTIRVPSADQVQATLCGGRVAAGTGLIVGSVYLRGEDAANKGAVVAEWTDITLRDNAGVAVERAHRRLDAGVDSLGRFRLCGVPLNTALVLHASNDSAQSLPKDVKLADGRFARVELRMDQRAEHGAIFAGTVLDSAKKPIIAAEVSFPELQLAAATDQKGAFRVSGIPAGEQHVVVRRVGYGPLDTKVTFAANRTIERDVVLGKATTLDSVIVNAARNDEDMRGFEEHRKLGLGHFMTRAELAKNEPRHLGDILRETPGLGYVAGRGNRGFVYSRRRDPCPDQGLWTNCTEANGVYFPKDAFDAAQGIKPKCYSVIVLDGSILNPGHPTPPFDLTSIPTENVEAVEYYDGTVQTPMQYSTKNECGVVVLHSRRWEGKPPKIAGSVFSGAVLDSAKHAVFAAEVSLPGLQKSSVTDKDGKFKIIGIPKGTQKVTVRRIGYGPVDTSLPFDGIVNVTSDIALARAKTADSIVVTAGGSPALTREFEANRRADGGKFLTRAELAKQETRSLADVLGELSGVAVVKGNAGQAWIYGAQRAELCPPACTGAYRPTGVELAQGMQARCYASVYLDGALMAGDASPPFDVSSIPVVLVDGVEFFAAAAPARYAGHGACGVLAIHTRARPR